MRSPVRFLVLGAAGMLGAAAVTGQPEFILPAVLLASGAAFTRRAANHRKLVESLAEMEQRLSLTEGELEHASGEMERLRVEREFDRQLLRPPTTPR